MMKATKFSDFLQDREELKFIDRPHWIYLFEAAIWSLLIVAVGFLAHSFLAAHFIIPQLQANAGANGLILNMAGYLSALCFWGSIIFAIIYFLKQLVFWASTYVFASDRRLYMKTGLIRVLVNEVSFDEIRRTDINYGFFGRFLGYGKLILDARFVEDAGDLPFIYYPETFAKLIHHENDLTEDINLRYVTNNMPGEVERIIPEKNEVKDQVPTMREQAAFAEHAFSQEEQENLQKQEGSGNELEKEFDIVADTPNVDIEKPAHKTPRAVET